MLLWLLILIIGQCYASLSEPKSVNMENQTSPNYYGWNYVRGSIWPIPQYESRQGKYFAVHKKKFSFKSVGKVSDVLKQALVRYQSILFPINLDSDGGLKLLLTLEVNVVYDYKAMDLSTDESYTLVISAPTAVLTANTVWGAIRGLETFSQTVHESPSGTFYQVEENKVIDFPRFHHRGFLIDTSRHFVNKEIIKQFIDALAYSKFNVLHWHIVDDESFPYVSKEFPDLSNKGARDNVKSVYTPNDVKEIIEFGRLRGVRIVPEFDTPGHTRSWGGVEDLLTPCYSGGKKNGQFGPINPTKESTYTFLKKFFAETANVFPDSYLHLGGDEVSFNCWASNPEITDWMSRNGMGRNFALLEQYYEKRLLEIVNGLGKKVVIWQEVFDNKVKIQRNTIINVWKGGWQGEMARLSKLGYRTILSSCWYLNYIGYGGDWEKYYRCDPHDFPGTQEQKDSVIGGTACMWGEWVDGVNLIQRSWGRGMSVGGRLWSSKETRDIGEAYRRMWEHRCRYLMRGIGADTITAYQYCRHEWQN